MKAGMTLANMANAIKEQHETKRDYVAGTSSIYLSGDSRLCLQAENSILNFNVTDQTHQQIASRLKIPSTYYQRMLRESPGLLAENVNTWFALNPESRMVRTLGNNARAFLSDRYLVIDNLDIVEAIFPVLNELGLGKNIASCDLSTDKMYLKIVNPSLQAEIKEGDIVQSGFILTNSETGKGSTTVQPLIYRLVCTNGLIVPDAGLRRIHLGRKSEDDSIAAKLYSPATRLHERQLYLRQIVDVVRSMSDPRIFDRIVNMMRGATNDAIEAAPNKAVEVLAERVKLSEEEQSGVLNHLLLAGDLSRYGMLNAITRYSQDVESYDRATELEELGSKMLFMSTSEWGSIATAGV
jgi:Domain of unknown function (DUF932)